jgi:hypothetical protein
MDAYSTYSVPVTKTTSSSDKSSADVLSPDLDGLYRNIDVLLGHVDTQRSDLPSSQRRSSSPESDNENDNDSSDSNDDSDGGCSLSCSSRTNESVHSLGGFCFWN